MKKIVSPLMSFILTAALFPYNVDATEHIEESRYSAEEYIGMTEESESAYGEEPKYGMDDAHNLGSAAMERPSALGDIFASDKDWAKVSRFFSFFCPALFWNKQLKEVPEGRCAHHRIFQAC